MSVESYIEGWDRMYTTLCETVCNIRKVYGDSLSTDYLRSNLYLRGGRMFRIPRRESIHNAQLGASNKFDRGSGIVGKFVLFYSLNSLNK